MCGHFWRPRHLRDRRSYVLELNDTAIGLSNRHETEDLAAIALVTMAKMTRTLRAAAETSTVEVEVEVTTGTATTPGRRATPTILRVNTFVNRHAYPPVMQGTEEEVRRFQLILRTPHPPRRLWMLP